jgi:alpha-mannosidase
VKDPNFKLERVRKYNDEDILTTRIRESIKLEKWKYLETSMEDKLNDAYILSYDDSEWSDFALWNSWGGYDKVAWFRCKVTIPEEFIGKQIAFKGIIGPRDGGGSTAETLLYINGIPVQGIDIWHEEAFLDPALYEGSSEIQIALKCWSGVLSVPKVRVFKEAQLVVIDPQVDKFYYTIDTLVKCVNLLEESDLRRIRLTKLLIDTFQLVDFLNYKKASYFTSIQTALNYVQTGLVEYEKLEELKPTVTGVGHSHIDMGWLWRYSATREKASRTFSTVLNLMRIFPEYRYMHSSPQLYKFIKEDYPEIFQQVKDRIRDGQWEITGGMWVESDTNLPNGESLVRQFLFGKRYMKSEFGQDSKLLWLPDVFGYSGALPQIMKKSEIDYFMTTKISWNQYNVFPHDTFRWKGIDGSEIFTHFITTPEDGSWFYTYNGKMEPEEVTGIWENYKDKDKNEELLLAFGWGDGGGGPTKDMLERARVMKNIPGIPKVQIDTTENYFKRIYDKVNYKDLGVWDGELYFEMHRGTYTSQAYTKRANRKSENLLHDIEFLSVLADTLQKEQRYPQQEINDIWEKVLLNQFHDVLPGSSIRQVYEDCKEIYQNIEEQGKHLLTEAVSRISSTCSEGQESILVFNTIGWPRKDILFMPYSKEITDTTNFVTAEGVSVKKQTTKEGVLLFVKEIPAYGFTKILLSNQTEMIQGEKQLEGKQSEEIQTEKIQTEKIQLEKIQPEEIQPEASQSDDNQLVVIVETNYLENQFYTISLNDNGEIVSLLDKRANRQICCGKPMNTLCAFEDKPLRFDAWDIDIFYKEKPYGPMELMKSEVIEAGPVRGTLRLTWKFNESRIEQDMIIYQDKDRIDFKTHVFWQEEQVLLKAFFPVDIHATDATYDIQFGNIKRPTHTNTEWDFAQFEVCAHKWVDLSEGNYGVSLLNDCKYGHDIHENVIGITLIKSAISPDETADRGEHHFTYSLYPHRGGWRESDVQQAAMELNLPLQATPVSNLPVTTNSFGFIKLACDHIVLDTIKKAEDENASIIRLYEYKDQKEQSVTMTFGLPVSRVVETNLMEKELGEVPVMDGQIVFDIAGYEIKTYKVYF